MKELFDVQYLHEFANDSEVVGKRCNVADNLKSLVGLVNNPDAAEGRTYTIDHVDTSGMPYVTKEGVSWKYAYYDPNYDVKVAYAKGKTIEYKHQPDGIWYPWIADDEPDNWDGFEWRIKLVRTYKVGDVVNMDGMECMIISHDTRDNKYFVGGAWRFVDELDEYEKVDVRSIYQREHEDDTGTK